MLRLNNTITCQKIWNIRSFLHFRTAWSHSEAPKMAQSPLQRWYKWWSRSQKDIYRLKTLSPVPDSEEKWPHTWWWSPRSRLRGRVNIPAGTCQTWYRENWLSICFAVLKNYHGDVGDNITPVGNEKLELKKFECAAAQAMICYWHVTIVFCENRTINLLLELNIKSINLCFIIN